MDVELRSYDDEDFDEVRDLLEETEVYVPEVDTRDRFREKHERSPDSIIVAERDGRIIGAVFITDDATNVLITRLSVHPRFQGEGVGTRLLSAAEERLSEDGTRIAVAFADSSDAELVDWYRGRGYHSAGSYEMMWKDL